MIRKLSFFVLAVFAFVAIASTASLFISVTVVPLVMADVIELSVSVADEPGQLQAVLTYEMKTDTGDPYHHGSNMVILSPSQRTAVLAFIADLIDDANVAEGLVAAP